MIERESCFNCKHCSKEPHTKDNWEDVAGKRILYGYLCNKGRGHIFVWSRNELNNSGCSAWERNEEPQQISIFDIMEKKNGRI